MTTTYHIVGFVGSLRKQSINKALLLNAKGFLPANYQFTLADISEIPSYNQDLETDMPQSVLKLAELCKSADGFLISTPEYNYSIPGFLKNAFDWLSRQNVGTPLATKPVAIMGATPSLFGTSRAQINLRELLFALNMDPVTRPEVLVPQAYPKFDEVGTFTDEAGRQFLQMLVEALVKKVNQPK